MRWLKRDALNRAWRTILQGLIAVVLIPATTAAVDVVTQTITANGLTGVDWNVVGNRAAIAAVTAATMALLAYLHRAKLDPTRIPSAQPPLPPGIPPATGVAMSTPPEVRR